MGCFIKSEQAVTDFEKRLSPPENVEEFCYDLINSSLDNWRSKWYDKFQYFLQKIYYWFTYFQHSCKSIHSKYHLKQYSIALAQDWILSIDNVVPKKLYSFFFQDFNCFGLISDLENLPFSQSRVFDYALPDQNTFVSIVLVPFYSVEHKIFIKLDGFGSSFDGNHYDLSMVIFGFDNESIQGQLLGIHANFKDMGRIVEFTEFEDNSSAFLSAVSFQFPDMFLLPLFFR